LTVAARSGPQRAVNLARDQIQSPDHLSSVNLMYSPIAKQWN
jgi:hypothetical protein